MGYKKAVCVLCLDLLYSKNACWFKQILSPLIHCLSSLQMVCEELSAETMLTQFWQFYQQMEGNDHTKTTLDLEDTNRARLETSVEKGQALLWVIHTTEQPKQPRGKEAYTE